MLTVGAGLLLVAVGRCPPELFWGNAVFFTPFVCVAGVCWWGGVGAGYVVERSGDAIIAMRAEATEDGAYAEAEELARVEVPEGAELDVLGAH